MALSHDELRAPAKKPCNAQCVQRLEDHVVELSSQLDGQKVVIGKLTSKVEALTLQQVKSEAKVEALPNSIDIAGSYMTYVTVLIAIAAVAFTAIVGFFQYQQGRKFKDIADGVRKDILEDIVKDDVTLEAISEVVVNSSKHLTNTMVMVKNHMSVVVRDELRNNVIVKGEDGLELKVSTPGGVQFEGLDTGKTMVEEAPRHD